VLDFQLMQNEVHIESIARYWYSLIKDHISICLGGESHENCKICDMLVLQLKHCSTACCDISSCSMCHRVVAFISLHYAKCRQLQQQCCCSRYLAAYPNPSSTSSPHIEMVSVDRVRSYLLSVFPVLSDHEDDDVDDGDDGDFDSDSSDDSIMMPSFPSDTPSFQPTADETPGSAVPEGGTHGTARDLPRLSGRGINSNTSFLPPGFASNVQWTTPVLRSVGAAGVSDPRVCISAVAPPSNVGFPGGAIHSVPVTSRFRPGGKVRYGTKSQLRQFASLCQVYTDRARQDGMQTFGELPLGGIILDDFRDVSCLSVKLVMIPG